MDHNFEPGSESIEVKLFLEDEIPWDEMAFRVIGKTLVQHFKDRISGIFPFYVGEKKGYIRISQRRKGPNF